MTKDEGGRPNGDRDATAEEIAVQLSNDEQELQRATAALDQAQREYGQMTARNRYLSDEAHAQALKDYAPRLEEAEREVAGAAERIRVRARAAMQQTEREEPTLAPNEMAAAAARQALVRDEADRLPYDALHERLRQAVLAGDRPGMWLLSRYIRLRLMRGEEQALTPEQQAARGPLASAVSQVEERLRTGATRKVYDRALAVLTDAQKLESAATARRRSRQRYRFQTTHDVAWTEAR